MQLPAPDSIRTTDLRCQVSARDVCNVLGALLLMTAGAWLCPARAHAQINAPGHHPHYTAELEPHLVWQWNDDEAALDDGVGVGFRASIPIIQDGPVSTINNNLAISFGLDWAVFPECIYGGRCSEHDLWLPVTMQWNFFLTPMISIFPEFGLGFRDAIFDSDDAVCNGRRCRTSSLEVHPVLWFGGRFHLGNVVSLVVRLGTPSLQFGVSFFL